MINHNDQALHQHRTNETISIQEEYILFVPVVNLMDIAKYNHLLPFKFRGYWHFFVLYWFQVILQINNDPPTTSKQQKNQTLALTEVLSLALAK